MSNNGTQRNVVEISFEKIQENERKTPGTTVYYTVLETENTQMEQDLSTLIVIEEKVAESVNPMINNGHKNYNFSNGTSSSSSSNKRKAPCPAPFIPLPSFKEHNPGTDLKILLLNKLRV